MEFLGATLNGLILGSQYGLFAVGLALILGSMKIFNLGHPVLFVGGAYATLLMTRAGWAEFLPTPVIVLLGGIVGGLVAGLLLDLICLTPLRRSGKGDDITVALVTVGFTLASVAILGLTFGTDPKVIELPRDVLFRVGTATITTVGLMSIAVAVGLFLLLWWALRSTNTGLSIRTVAESPENAQLIGLNASLVTRGTVLAAAMAAGLGGSLYATNVSAVSPMLGEDLMVKGAAIVVVGGLGSIAGAIILSYAIGFAEVFTVLYVGSSYREVAALVLLVLVLSLRPTGLFGRSELERV